MARGDKNPLAEVSSLVESSTESSAPTEAKAEAGADAGTDEGGEIDRIMQEIEDLEKKMDDGSDMTSDSESGKVVALRQRAESTESSGETLAETDAVPAPDDPLMIKDDMTAGDGGLALKIGGCSEVSLEFSRAGITVTLTCDQETLCITTDQGAEFKIPFNRAA